MNFQILLPIYLIALLIEIFANITRNLQLQYFSKPSLMLILLFYYASNTRKLDSTKNLIIAALAFSWLGDVLLLFDKQFKMFFIFGLTAFLIAHIFYIFYFWKIKKVNNITKLPHTLKFVGIAVYTLSLFAVVAPNVQNLLVPVTIYALIISLMFAVSLAAFDLAKQPFGKLCVAGTFLFLVSDSLLAINRFVAPFVLASVLIMTTYAAAQLLIAEGSLQNLRGIKEK